LSVIAMANLTFVTSVGATNRRTYSGALLSGTNWAVALGDGRYSAPGVAPVDAADIKDVDLADRTELQANVFRRRIMAHNITFLTVRDQAALSFVHQACYSFRVPFVPTLGNFDLNAQTVEGGLFVWDGLRTRLDYGVGWQIVLNPWAPEFGDLFVWTGDTWQKVGHVGTDTQWHRVCLRVDPVRATTVLAIDGVRYPSIFSRTPKGSDFGTEVAARLQAEIVSLDPGPTDPGALHKAQFRNWTWTWT